MPTTTTGPSRRGNAHKRILLAVAIAAVGVGVLVYVFASRSGGPAQGPQGQGLPPVGSQQGLQLGGAGDQVARNVDISFVDREDPSRTQARMIAGQMAPEGSRGYIATEPRMWIYQSAGQTIHVMADRGDLAMPARSQPPERGTLTGDVVIRVYEPGVDTAPGVLDQASPAATFKTPALEFNVELGTVSTQEVVTGSAENLVFEVDGLDIRGNQVTSQLERLESPRGGTATFTPPPSQAKTPTPAQPGDQQRPPASTPSQPARDAPTAASGDQATQPEQPEATEQYYHLQIREGVRITRGTMTTDADALDAWVRLVDNSLPDNAIAPLGPRSAGVQLDTTARLMTALLATVQEGQPQDAAPGQPITLTWDGQLVARPLTSRPRELTTDDLAFRLSAPERGLVQVADAQLGARGHAATIDYYPTTQRAILLGPAANSVFVTAPGVGEARGIRVELDLLSETAALVGPGQLTALGEDQQGRIAWAERADMAFRRTPATDEADAGFTLRSANFRGKVNGQAQDARVNAETIDAEFFDADASQPLIRRLVMTREPNEPASASSDRTGSLSGDRIELRFELDDQARSVPRTLIATGAVEGRGQDATFTADNLTAQLAATFEDGSMRTQVERAELTGEVDLRAVDAQGARVTATGQRVLIRPQDQYAEIEAAGDAIATASRAGTEIAGPQIRLDALKGQAQVFGPGSLTHNLRLEDRPRPSTLTLDWDNFMLFDDAKGQAEADGNARINLTDGRTEEDRIAAANIQVAFTAPPEDAGDALDPQMAEGQRELLWARAEADPAPGSVVIIESRRFLGTSPDDRTLKSALVLMVPEATIDGPTSNIEAVGQGRAIILEQPDAMPLDHGATADRARGSFTDLARGGAGQALVDWVGAMTFDRADQRLVLDRGVRLSHRTGPDAAQLDLDCERLTITLEGLDRSRSATTLRQAVAEGAVYAATDDRELVARSLDYDARSGIIIASGDPMAPVVVFDKRSAQPASAASVRWNINTGEFTIVRPLPAGGAIPGG
ncbi:MAG: hypothetical protein ACIAS6_08810 [Phycisphaerales bacterium JB060]